MTFQRQSWREWIAFDLEWSFLANQNAMVQLKSDFGWLWKLYIPITYHDRATQTMTIAPVACLQLSWRAIKRAWFYPARVLYRNGLLPKIKPGEQVHWFWFRYF
jgi:hypothetical protein